MNATITAVNLTALYSALVDAAAATHHALGDNYGQAGGALRTAAAHAPRAFPDGSPEAAALNVILAAVSNTVSEMRERRNAPAAHRLIGAS